MQEPQAIVNTPFIERKDHRGHAAGAERDPRFDYWNRTRPREVIEHIGNRIRYCSKMDQAWTVMLYRQGLIERDTAQKLLNVLADAQGERGFGGEDWLKKRLDDDEYVASAVNFGRTLQEPMARMQMRDTLLDVFDLLHEARRVTLKQAEKHVDTIMAGQSHMSHAQPTTYGQYLLTVHDGMSRAEEQLNLAYRFTNMNSGGCGACSGTGWPVDRQLVTDLLGFDGLIDLVYDCEASQDEVPQILYAMSNLAMTLDRATMDHEVWSLEEIGMMAVGPTWKGLSSFMPQKAHSGGVTEQIRISCNEIFGKTVTCMFTFKNELLQDNLPVFRSPDFVIQASGRLQAVLGLWSCMLPDMLIYPARMKQIVKDGFSGAPDLAIVLIRQLRFAGRQAHRVCASAVRMARERNIKPYQMTGELLDEAAALTDDPKPGLTTAQVQECMGLDQFFEKHCNTGDPCPVETRRLIEDRYQTLDIARRQQTDRKKRLTQADAELARAISDVLAD